MKEIHWKQNIACFLSAQTISLFGSSIVQYAIVWHITLTTSSGKMLTISTLCGFLPQIIVSLFAGALIDRYSRKKIVMLSDSVIALSTLLLAITFLAGYENYLLLFLVLIIRSAGTGIQVPSANAIIPQIVPTEKLMRVNGINSTLSSLIMFISPAVSGAILSVSSIEVTLLIDVITAVIGVGITSVVFIKPHSRETAGKNTYLSEVKEGFSYLKKNRFIKHLLIFQILILFFISPSAFLTPLLINRTFGTEVWRLTIGEMTYSLGMIMGGLLITSWGGFQKKLHTTMAAGGFYGLLMIGLGISPVFPAYAVCNTLIGITSPCYNTPLTVTIQEKTDPQMHGRIFSFMQISTSCALPLGMALFGPLADIVRPQFLLITAGIIVVSIVFYAYFSSYFKEHAGDNVSL